MHVVSLLVLFFSLFASVVSAVTLYRGDARGPEEIERDGGFWSIADRDHAKGTLIEHWTMETENLFGDPYIPTTIDINAAKKMFRSKYIYHIDSDKIGEQFYDVTAEFAKAGVECPWPEERAFVVEYHIPWEAITKVERIGNDASSSQANTSGAGAGSSGT